MGKIILGHSTEPDPDGQKHEWMQYRYKDYIFNKEWYMDMEGKYVMGLTIFKKSDEKAIIPFIKYENDKYYEIFHSGNCKDTTDDEMIELVEMIRRKYEN